MILRWLAILTVLIVLAFGFVIWRSNPEPYERAEIEALAAQLFEFGAVRYFIEENPDDALFVDVSFGVALNDAKSCEFRKAFTARIADQAGLLSKLDQELVFATNFGSDARNNCDEMGIMGRHDLHDQSAKANIEDIDQSLKALGDQSWFAQILSANNISKDLEDLMVHFAPAVHALGVEDASFQADLMDDELEARYNQMIAGFKSAQFAPVHSCAYWQGVDQALLAYVDLVKSVDDRTYQSLSRWQRRLAGRWLALQTLAPQLNPSEALRPRPTECAEAAAS